MEPLKVKDIVCFLQKQDQNKTVSVFDGNSKMFVYDIHDTELITTKGLPPLKEMEGEILKELENLDIIVHGDRPMIGNRFGTASAIYNLFEKKLKDIRR